jgi:hypothetical protein
MNGTVSRRVFVGSLAGAGVGALGATSLDLSLSAQPAAVTPLLREIRGQLKDALGKMRDGHADGARQAATILRLYASTVNDGDLRAAAKKANRQRLLLTAVDHRELAREAKELGLDPARLRPHSMDRVGREAALDRILKDGLSPSLREIAGSLDGLGAKLDDLAKRQGGPRLLAIALRQPIPDQVDCGNCNAELAQVEYAESQAAIACALAAAFPLPPIQAACAAASIALIVILSAYGICAAYVQLCRSYYGQ